MTLIIKNRMRIPIDIFDRVPVMSHALMRLFSNEVMRAKSLNRDIFELFTKSPILPNFDYSHIR